MKLNAHQLKLLAEGASMEVVMAAGDPDQGDDAKGDVSAINAEVAAQLVEANARIVELETEAAAQKAALEDATTKAQTADAAKAEAETLANSMRSAVLARASTLAVALKETPPAADISAADLSKLATELDTKFKAVYKPGQQTLPTNTPKVDVKAQAQQAAWLAQAKNLPAGV